MTISPILSTSTDDLVGSVEPRIWTPRRPGTDTLGPLIADVAALAGLELDNSQRLGLDVACEHVDGRWTRTVVGWLCARQNGKTQTLKARVLGGLFVVDTDRLILHTAQDRAVPRELFEELVTVIGDTRALHRRVDKIRETNGQESIRLKDGSTYRIIAPRAKAFRSWSADLLVFDEAREQRDWEVWGAAVPTQRVRPNPQRWVVSNAGDPDSVVLNATRDRGRAAAAGNSDDAIAYLEWSAPDDAAIDDPAGWAAANPALGRRLTADAIIEEMRSLSEERFRTEVLCQWVATTTAAAIPPEAWAACSGTPSPVEPGELPRPVMAVHISGDRTYAAVAMAAVRDGRLVVDLADEWHDDHGVDLLDVTSSTIDLMRRYRVRDLAYDRTAASVIAQRLDRIAGLTAHRIDATEYVTASQNLYDAVTTGWLLHPSRPSLDHQATYAGRRDRPDGTWWISQADSAVPIAGLLAVAFAVNLAYRPHPSTTVHTR